MNWYEFIPYAVGIAGLLIGGKYWVKFHQFVKLLKEMGEAFTKTADVLADKKVTKAEAIEVLGEWMDVCEAFFALVPQKLIARILNK